MIYKMITPNKLFAYIRGALRGLHGLEDLRGKVIVILGMDSFGRALISMFRPTEATLYFQAYNMQHYYCAHVVCGPAEPWNGQQADIVVDVESKQMQIGKKTIPFEEIGKEPYTQGIHDFYL